MTDSTAVSADLHEDADLRALRDEVWERLQRRQLSSRWFYDRRGSELFERITRLPEYYPTRTELALLEAHAGAWMERLRPGSLVELGAGSARKTRVLLDAQVQVVEAPVYVPLDVSADFLRATAKGLRADYPELRVVPEVGDLTRPLRTPRHGHPPALFALLGSTLGNFSPDMAIEILRHVAHAMERGDRFLMGADLAPGPGKSVPELVAAYDDAQGVTADFNRNMLRVLNARAGTDFEPEAFAHRAVWNDVDGRIEMHLVSREGATVTVPGRGVVTFAPGDSVRTEISTKYDRATLDRLFGEAGLEIVEEVADPDRRYAMVLARLASA